MIVNSFILCGTATATGTGNFDITDAGIREVQVPVAEDWRPGQPLGFQLWAALFAANQSTDTSPQPYVDIQWRSAADPANGKTVRYQTGGWVDGLAGSKFIHEVFPLTLVAMEEGPHMVTVHPEGLDGGMAAAFYLLDVKVLKL